jgi:Holliday junction resolvase-like predicted endonuclease
MVHVNTTAAPLRASAIFELKILEILKARGWRELRHNVRIGRVQVDLIGRDPSGILTLVEVKMSTHYLYLTSGQQARLFRASDVLAEFEPVQMILATISGGHLRLLPVDGLTV